jgi:hypothetical protein
MERWLRVFLKNDIEFRELFWCQKGNAVQETLDFGAAYSEGTNHCRRRDTRNYLYGTGKGRSS